MKKDYWDTESPGKGKDMAARLIPQDKWLINFERQMDRLKSDGDREHRKTYDEVFDRKALLNIYKLFSRRIISTVEHPISTGKEANVFKATGRGGGFVVLKIFREATSTFKRMLQYIDGDPRFNTAGKGRRTISIWAQKEYKNLKRLEAVGVMVPRPLAVLQNMIVMEYVGDEHSPALRLKDCVRSNLDFDNLFSEIMENLERMVKDARVVHADLSEYNILLKPAAEHMNFDELGTGGRKAAGSRQSNEGSKEGSKEERKEEKKGEGREKSKILPPGRGVGEKNEEGEEGGAGENERNVGDDSGELEGVSECATPVSVHPVIIDLGQATLLEHPMALEFLERDLRNIVRFFVKNRLLEEKINEKEFIEKKLESLSRGRSDRARRD